MATAATTSRPGSASRPDRSTSPFLRHSGWTRDPVAGQHRLRSDRLPVGRRRDADGRADLVCSRASRARSTWRARPAAASGPRRLARLLRRLDIRAAAGGRRERRRQGRHRHLCDRLPDGLRRRLRGRLERLRFVDRSGAPELSTSGTTGSRSAPTEQFRIGDLDGDGRTTSSRSCRCPGGRPTRCSRWGRRWRQTCSGRSRSSLTPRTCRSSAIRTATGRTSSSSRRGKARCMSRYPRRRGPIRRQLRHRHRHRHPHRRRHRRRHRHRLQHR